MIAPNPTGAATTQGNLLQPFAWALFRLRAALDDAPPGRLPRWVRIARGATIADKDFAEFMRSAVGVLLGFVGALHALLLDLEEALVSIDAPKAAIELILEMGKAATAPELGAALANLFDDDSIASAFADANRALSAPDRVLDYIPEPVDVMAVGRQVYELLAISPTPNVDATALSITGRLRLLSWAYKLPIKVPAYALDGKGKGVPVAALGVRRRDLRADEEPLRCTASWPRAAGAPVPLLDLDLSKGADLDELLRLLDTLGYDKPAIAPGAQRLDGAHTVRLRVFQYLNDLPLTGDLDPETLQRLLGLDRVQRTVARPRPYDPARWRRIPKAPERRQEVREQVVYEDVPVFHTRPEDPLGHGTLSIVNPDADHYEDEKIPLVTYPGALRDGQTVPKLYYEAGARVVGDDAVFPDGVERGWIRHLPDDDWLFQEKTGRPPAFGCCFVGMESRHIAPSKKAFEGGELSEGRGYGGSRFFFSAREVEPWIAGRNGDPRGKYLFRDRKWPPQSISGMYQWVPLDDVLTNVQPGERLYMQATVFQRSLYKERGVGYLPDQGRVVLGLVRKEAIASGWTVRSRFKASYLDSWAWSGWWPTGLQATLEGAQDLVLRGEQWIQLATPGLRVSSSVVGVFVGLYGKHNANWDTDAYFDEVEISWWRERAAQPSSSAGGTT